MRLILGGSILFQHLDRADVTVPSDSRLRQLGVETMSAVAFVCMRTDIGLWETSLAEAVRQSLTRCYNAKIPTVTYMKDLRNMLVGPWQSPDFRGYHKHLLLGPWHSLEWRKPTQPTASTEEGDEIEAADADEILNFALHSPYLGKVIGAKLIREVDFQDAPIDKIVRLGKPVFAMSPHQYERMREANERKKADLRARLEAPEELSCTIEWYPEGGYPDLPELKAELKDTYQAEDPRMKCSENTLQRLAAYWPEEHRLGSTVWPKC